MGGRGASSGRSSKGNKYGTQYRTIFQAGNIKFVTKKTRQSEDLLETRTKGRIYATIGGKDLLRITLFDSSNKRNKVIERDKRANTWHVHHGYEHTEYSETKHEPLSAQDHKILDRVQRLWQNHR